MQSEPETTKYAVLHEPCTRIYIIEVPVNEYTGEPVDCPRCNSNRETVEIQSDDHRRYSTCVEATCSQYLSSAPNSDGRGRCEGQRTDKSGTCNAALEELSFALIDELPADNALDPEDDRDPAEVRRLKSEIQKVRRWIQGSGAHHRSKGGSHTAQATQTHSAAHGAKKRVRNAYSAELKRLAGAVDAKKYATLVQEANGLANDVLNK
jgi:hypothetical protein